MIRRRMLLAAALLPLAATCAPAGREVPEPRPVVADPRPKMVEPRQEVAVPDAGPDSASIGRCPVEGYCENVTRQVQRFFHPPAGSAGASGEVCFRLQRDGGVTGIHTRRVRGGAMFRLALMEAAEAAGAQRAFGTLPDIFDARWTWCVELSPS